MDSFLAGAAAGLVVDLSLYPIDTVKTRIQSKEGFLASGGFKNIYKGLSAVAVGSVPGGAAFFFTYDGVKRWLLSGTDMTMQHNAMTQMNGTVFAYQSMASMCGETTACCIRVPVEMVKQQMQAGRHHSILSALRCITNNCSPTPSTAGEATVAASYPPLKWSGVRYLFSGMPIMLMRELPFSVIQMTLYESLKYWVNQEKHSQVGYYVLLPFCGAAAGGTAAFVTTPLDVIKTRIMLQRRQSSETASIRAVVRDILTEPPRPGDRFGVAQKFFRGAATRVLWISLGGSVFFGTYEVVKKWASAVV